MSHIFHQEDFAEGKTEGKAEGVQALKDALKAVETLEGFFSRRENLDLVDRKAVLEILTKAIESLG